MPDTTQKQSHTMVERMVAMIEEQQTVSNARSPALDTTSQAWLTAPVHVPAGAVPLERAERAERRERGERRQLRELKSPWPVRIAGFAAIFGIGMGIGNWFGHSAQPDVRVAGALAQETSIYSLPAEPPLRIDRDFANIQPRRR
jgi:hypothetical protein